MTDQKVVLVTGASSGVGQATARLLAERGYQVFGTSRNPSKAHAISGVEMLPLDVCADESVRACIDAVVSRSSRLDVLINNAGYELAGAVEEVSVAEAKAQFETNFFGVVRMVRAAVPLMRRQKRGHVINVSSLAGLVPVPFMGMYSASKFALEGYSESLWHELKPFGIRVSLTEAGFLNTPIAHHRQTGAAPIDEYDRWRDRALNSVRAQEAKGPGAEEVAEAMAQIVASPRPRMRYAIGAQAKSTILLKRFLPASMFNAGLRRNFSLDVPGTEG
jgi:NAD(P)-dependent dehydrogenase (short-subunit alcohol dehydrogenase family)